MSEEERKLGWTIVKMWRDYEAIYKDDATLDGFLLHLEINCRPTQSHYK